MLKGALILIVDQQREQAGLLTLAFEKKGAKVDVLSDYSTAVETIEKCEFDLIIADVNLGSDVTGFDILAAANQKNPSPAVILTTEHPSIDTCKQAIRSGALDYIEKPLDIAKLLDIAEVNVNVNAKQQGPVNSLEGFVFPGIIGRSHATQNVFHILRRVAPTDISVLVEGESGTGKELTAKAIHDNSPRRNRTFVPLNCAGLSETLLESELFGHAKGAFTGAAADRKGLFEVADKGTLFLDEIGDMPMTMQAKLLRVLEDGVVVPVGSSRAIKVDVRVISATNHDLAKLVEEKDFRQDLYFRIKGVSVTLPSLRTRPEDIPELFGYFLKEASQKLDRDITRITESAMKILVSYDWPGNIRQLRHCIRTMVVMCDSDTLDIRDIPLEIHHVKRLPGKVTENAAGGFSPISEMAGMSLEQVEKLHIENTLALTNDNRAEAAKILKIGERTLYRKIKDYGL